MRCAKCSLRYLCQPSSQRAGEIRILPLTRPPSTLMAITTRATRLFSTEVSSSCAVRACVMDLLPTVRSFTAGHRSMGAGSTPPTETFAMVVLQAARAFRTHLRATTRPPVPASRLEVPHQRPASNARAGLASRCGWGNSSGYEHVGGLTNGFQNVRVSGVARGLRVERDPSIFGCRDGGLDESK